MKRPTKKELLKMPERTDLNHLYDEILLVPTGKLHDSGYMTIAVIGGIFSEPRDGNATYEICAYPDHVMPIFPLYKYADGGYISLAHIDCLYPSGIIRYWGRGKFKVGMALSSTEIELIIGDEWKEKTPGSPRA
jgi:hypothetical protein